jgi:parvulin-like peptidyl-prolyl isomerase
MNTLNRLRCGLSMLGVLGVVALGEAQSAAQTSPTTTAAVVNGSKITLAEVDAVLKARPTLGPLTAAQQRQLRFEILSVMIDEMLLQQYFDKHGPKVEPAEVEAQLKALSEALARQKLTLQSYCAEQGITEKKLREGIKIVQQLTRYTEAKMTDAALRQYYEANRAYFDKVTVRAAHIVLRVPANAPESERAQARQKLAAMRAELLAGKADFAELAKRYSQCPSAARGGDIGFFAAKWMDLDESFAAGGIRGQGWRHHRAGRHRIRRASHQSPGAYPRHPLHLREGHRRGARLVRPGRARQPARRVTQGGQG